LVERFIAAVTNQLTKQCSKCCTVKPLSEFFKRKNSSDGFNGQCKICYDQKNSRWEKANPVKTQTMYMTCAARARAKKKGLAFDIDAAFLRSIVTENCPILGMKLEWSTLRGHGSKMFPNSPSLDRIVPERGYVKGNVWIISHRANMLKSNASHEELKLVTEAVGRAIVNSLDW
jgi:hypothetical protein